MERIKKSFHWSGVKEFNMDYSLTYDKCAARNPSRTINMAHLGQYIVGEPMETVGLDIPGPLTLTERSKALGYLPVQSHDDLSSFNNRKNPKYDDVGNTHHLTNGCSCMETILIAIQW
ncbi:hypothetical protein CHS0354_032652 [Potamilus streckersoni]|uniref:Uncharacterized protein n=1 Tax=Potamilus streckersoni TaxID=2493646 RepID=A0AAE0SGA2_9BIVA|nr:hypothetical protein CHS0354_032652 [Potamilus streckersoni]